MSKKNYNVVCALIYKDNKIFCVQRPDKGEVGLKWEFPGGKIESNESKEEALIREIYEELNCKIKVLDYLGVVQHEYNSFSLTLHAFKCEMVDGYYELKEHINSCWIDKDTLYNLDFAEADVKLYLDLKQLNKL
jgi:8-oxo-dGTP diphosphatase